MKRVQDKVFKNIPAAAGQDPNLRFQWLRAYLWPWPGPGPSGTG